MQRVLYHNAIDILSLVTLATRLCRAFEDPWHHGPGLNGAELYGLGRWYAAEKRTAEAERAFRSALQDDMDQEVRERALQSLALILKQADRRPEAVEFWQQAALENEQETRACVELAKYYEWHGDDLNLALSWTCEGLAHVSRWPTGTDREIERQELTHRRERLERKLSDQRGETASDA
jgi:tetratricopeptide (TPR) repeat protein